MLAETRAEAWEATLSLGAPPAQLLEIPQPGETAELEEVPEPARTDGYAGLSASNGFVPPPLVLLSPAAAVKVHLH